MQKNNNTKPLILALLLVSSNMYAQNKIELQPEDKEVKNSKKVQKHTSNVSAKIGLGYDSNPFLSPRNPYNDYTNSGGGALVTPENKSGLYTPISLSADYEYRYSKDIRLLADAKLSGDFFYDKDLENANKHNSKVSTGIRYRMNKYKKEINRIDLNLFAGHVHEIYVDHDDGALKTTIGGDQSNRYQYTTNGAELKYMYDRKKVGFLFRARYEDRDYATPDSWSSLDHSYMRVKLMGEYRFSKRFEAGAYYEYRFADYVERKAYENVAGSISLVNPGVDFTYNDIKLFTSYKLNKTYKVGLSYYASNRTDSQEGYSDLLLHTINVNNKFRIQKGLYSSLNLKYTLYDYKNAYAYDSLTYVEIKKEASNYQIDLDTKYKINPDLFSSLDLKYKRTNSTDKRYEYDDIVAVLNLKYKF